MIQQEAINCSSSSKAAHTHTSNLLQTCQQSTNHFFNLEKSRFQQLQIHLPQVQNGTYHILNRITNWVRFKQQIKHKFISLLQTTTTEFNWFQLSSQVISKLCDNQRDFPSCPSATESSLPMFICNVNFWINTILTTTTKSGMQSILIGWN